MIVRAILPAVFSLRWIRRQGAALAWLLIAGVPATFGQILTSTWIGSAVTGTGNWSTSILWLPAPQPGSNVTINNLLLFPANVTLDVDATVNELSLGTGATLAIASGRTLQLNSNSIINGSLMLNATNEASELVLANSALTLAGTGTITMSANPNNRIRGLATTDGLINQTTIQGGGSIGLGFLGFANQGSIIANQPLVPLVITPRATGATNTGTLRATNGATLTFQSAALNNNGGTIEARTGSTVALSNATITAGSLTTEGTGAVTLSNTTLAGVTVTNSAGGIIRALSGINTLYGAYTDFATSQVRVDNGARMVMPGGAGSVTLNGGIYVDSTGSDTVLEIGATGLVVDGAGKVVLSDNPNNRVIGTGNGASVTFGPNLTVQGSGQLGGGSLNLTNQGSIIANQSNALIVQPGSLGMSNAGTLRSTGGATLVLQNGTFSNTGSGTIVADTGSHIDVSNSTVNGGVLTSVGTGHFHSIDSVLSNVTITAGSSVEVANGDALTLAGNIVNDGVVSLLSSGSTTELNIDSAASITGAGTISLSNSANNRIAGTAAGSTLSIGAAQTIAGAGAIGGDTLALTNLGTITANRTTALVIDNAGATFTNHGTLNATGSGGLTFSDASVTNLGTLDVASGSKVTVAGTFTQSGAASATKLAGGTFTAGGFVLQEGALSGAGTISGPVTATGEGIISPGGAEAIGTLAFTSTLDLGASTGLFFDLGGTAAGVGHDRINGTTISLNGSLFLSFANGFETAVTNTDTLTLINTSVALNGVFASLPNGSRLTTLDGFGSFQVNYLSNSLTLSDFQAIPEPSTYVLLTVGAFGVWLAGRRRRRR